MHKIARKSGSRVLSGASVFKFFAAASALLALLVLLSPCQLSAQLVTGDVLGTVTDSTGAVVPDAKITVHSTGTGYTRTEQSGKTGEFLFSALQIGAYKVTVEAKGFKTYVQNGLVLAVGDRARVDAKLEVGSQVETVEIEASAVPALKTDSSTMDTLITTTAVADLPLNGRNITNLVQLSAGVTEGAANAPGGAAWVGGHQDDLRQTSAFSANGQNDVFNNQMVDGMDNNERTIGTQVIKPSIDAIDQVQVMTNLYPAEYGRSEGGVMNVITKSGTNKFHGSLFEYIRNDDLDAYNYAFHINNLDQTPTKGELRQNQFGGSLGGPIFKNKTFFFGDYEGFRYVSGLQVVTATVPTAAIRAAVASAGVGGTAVFTDPFGTSSNPTYSATVTQLGMNLLSLYPAPNQGGASATSNNFTWDPKATQNANTYDGRIDHHFSDKDLIFGRYSYNNTDSSVPSGLPAVIIGSNSFSHASPSTITTQGLGMGWTHVFSPILLLEVKAGYSRFHNHGGVGNGANAATELGFNGCPTVNLNNSSNTADPQTFCINSPYGGASEGLPSISVGAHGAYDGIGDGMWGPLNNTNQSYQYMGSLTWNHGNHSMKTGASLIRRQMARIQSPSARGDYDIGGYITGSAVGDMLEGIASGAEQQTTLSFPNFRSWEPSVYAQDDWRAFPWLTVNLGVRYDIYTPFTDAHGEFSNFNYAEGIIQSPSLVGIYQGTRTDDIKTDFSNISPRLGFSASLAHQIVVRGGVGVSYFTNEEGGGTVVSMANFPYTWSENYGDTNYQPLPSGMTSSKAVGVCSQSNTTGCAINMAVGIPEPFVSADTVANLPGGTEIDGVANDLKSGRLTQYSMEIQKEIGPNVFAVGYIGNAGRHLPWVPNVNQATYATAEGQGPTPYTSATTLDGQNLTGDSIYATSSTSTSNYNALQATFTRRLVEGHGQRLTAG
jgi:hypothetical protein